MRITFLAAAIFFCTQLSAFADIVRFMQIDTGLYRGGQPTTEADYDRLQALGIRTIVNLRTGSSVAKERAIAEKRGIHFVHAPMSSVNTVILAPRRKSVDLAYKTITDQTQWPVFLHCAAGKDRTGMMSAIYRVLEQNWHTERAHDEMMQMGFNPIFGGLDREFWYRTSQRRGDLEFDVELAHDGT